MPPRDYYTSKKSSWGVGQSPKTSPHKPPSESGGKGQDKGKGKGDRAKEIEKEARKRYERQRVIDEPGGSSTKEAFIAGSGSKLGQKPPKEFKKGTKEHKSFGLAQDEKAIEAFSEGDLEKVKDYEFEDPRNEATANKKFIKLLEGAPEKDTKGFIESYSKANIPSALLSMVFNPKPRQFTDANFLAILKNQLDPKDYARYFSQWKDVISEGMGGTGVVSEDFEKFKNAIESASIPQGSEAQKRYAPWDYYDDDLYYDDSTGIFGDSKSLQMSEYDLAMQDYPKFLSAMGLKPLSSRFANTTSNLVDIANIDPNTVPEDESDFRNRIFQARQELDRQGRNWMTGNQQSGYSQSGSSLTPIAGLPRSGIEGLPQAATTPVTTTATTPVTTTGIVDLTPTPTQYPVYGTGVGSLDWSQFGPHFGPQYYGHPSHWVSGYANGGIVRLLNKYG